MNREKRRERSRQRKIQRAKERERWWTKTLPVLKVRARLAGADFLNVMGYNMGYWYGRRRLIEQWLVLVEEHGVKSLPGDWYNDRWYSQTQAFIDKPEEIWTWMKRGPIFGRNTTYPFAQGTAIKFLTTPYQGKTTP